MNRKQSAGEGRTFSPAQQQQFTKDIRQSNLSVAVAAAWISLRGSPVYIPELEVGEFVHRPDKGQDAGDLFAKINGTWRRVEVKHRTDSDFTGPASFQYPTMIVCDVNEYHQRPGFFYVVFNRTLRHAAIVKKSTRRYWKTETLHVEGRDQKTFTVPTAIPVYAEVPFRFPT